MQKHSLGMPKQSPGTHKQGRLKLKTLKLNFIVFEFFKLLKKKYVKVTYSALKSAKKICKKSL